MPPREGFGAEYQQAARQGCAISSEIRGISGACGSKSEHFLPGPRA
jgi:hypothetical protein